MNKLNLWGFLLLVLCTMHQSDAQEAQSITGFTCEQKAAIIIQSKLDLELYSDELIDEMIAFIEPCADDYFYTPSIDYARGLLYLQKGGYGYVNGQYRELSQGLIERAAKANYPPAVFEHAMNFVTRKYITSGGFFNPNVAVPYFKKCLDLDYKTEVANYVLGYITLKNLWRGGDVLSGSNVRKAKRYFEKSNLPMAKHWLAIMHFYGYGTRKNEAKALQMLVNNSILNSQTLAQQLQSQNNDWIPISAEERLACLDFFDLDNKAVTLIGDSKTTFSGNFLEFDWPAKGVRRRIPLTLEIDITNDLGHYKEFAYTFTSNDITTTGSGRLRRGSLSDEISFTGGLSLPVKRILQDHPDKDTITYSIGNLMIKETVLNNESALIARVHPDYSKVVEFDEKMRAPFRMILYPDTPARALLDTTAAVADNALKTAPQPILDTDFAVIAPNPIGDQFTITYTLDQEADIQVSVYDFYGQQRIHVPSQKNSVGQSQVITIDSAALSSGTYVVQITINGSPYSKTVIKL